jgi:hemerythrin-like domain-containing protein
MESSAGPIKRHPAIVQFSREHHYGLLLNWKIRQGLKQNIEPERITNYILYFFEEDLKYHFAEEERILFAKLDDADPLKQQALKDHEAIYGIIAGMPLKKADVAMITLFAEALEKHIRFEERVLFNHLQTIFSEAELATIAAEHPERKMDTDAGWTDHFWVTL